jgi:hypothetical protein
MPNYSINIEGSTLPHPISLTKAAESEFKVWNNGKIKEAEGTEIIDKYRKEVPGIASYKDPWSAVFVSYLMLRGDADFPKSASHHDYATSALNGEKGYELFPLKAGFGIKAEVGDILIMSRDGDYISSHGDLIYKVTGNVASLIGGNVSNTVRVFDMKTNGGYIDDSVDTKDYKLLVKKTGNAYYKGQKLQFKSRDGILLILKEAKLTSAETVENKKRVKNFFKAKGLNKNLTAGIMGNIDQETGGSFNPNIVNQKDTNGLRDYGLLQFNEGSYDLSKVGSTVESQLEYLLTTPNFDTFIKYASSDSDTSAYKAAYNFARYFEVCYGCNQGFDKYKSESTFHQANRSEKAKSYYDNFNDPNSDLYW